MNCYFLQELLASRFDRLESLLCPGCQKPPQHDLIKEDCISTAASPPPFSSNSELAANQQTLQHRASGWGQVCQEQNAEFSEPGDTATSVPDLIFEECTHGHTQASVLLNLPVSSQSKTDGSSSSSSLALHFSRQQQSSDAITLGYSELNSEAGPDAGVDISAFRQSIPGGRQEALFVHDGQVNFSDCHHFSINNNDDVGRKPLIDLSSTDNITQVGQNDYGVGTIEFVRDVDNTRLKTFHDCGDNGKFGKVGNSHSDFVYDKTGQEAVMEDNTQAVADCCTASSVDHTPLAENFCSHLESDCLDFGLQSRNLDSNGNVVNICYPGQNLELQEHWLGHGNVFCCPSPSAVSAEEDSGRIDSSTTMCNRVSVWDNDAGCIGDDRGCRLDGFSGQETDQVDPNRLSCSALMATDCVKGEGASAGSMVTVVTADLAWITS